MNKIDYNKELDCTGLSCPLPVLKTKKMVDSMNHEEILKMNSTDPGSKNDITSWIESSGNELLSRGQDGEKLIFFIKKA